MRDFLTRRLTEFASSNPQVEFEVVRKSGHPVVKGFYNNGRDKAICVKSLNIDNVENKLKLLLNSSGDRIRKPKQNVESLNQSVRGIWSPFHVDPNHRHKI